VTHACGKRGIVARAGSGPVTRCVENKADICTLDPSNFGPQEGWFLDHISCYTYRVIGRFYHMLCNISLGWRGQTPIRDDHGRFPQAMASRRWRFLGPWWRQLPQKVFPPRSR